MDSHQSSIRPCKALTLRGKMLLWITRMLVGFLSVLTGTPRKHPIEFEENSLNMTAKELLYFAFKYYVKNVSNGNKFGYLKLPAGYKSYHPSIPSELKLHIGGDLMPYKLIQEKHCEQFWLERKDFFKADIVAANLETPIDIDRKEQLVPEIMLSNMHFNGNLEQFNIFSGFPDSKGYDVLSLANNHSLDMGYAGIVNTTSFLHQRNIQTCGIGKPNERHCIIDKNGFKIGFISWTYSLNHLKPNEEEPFNVNVLPLNKIEGCSIKEIEAEAKRLKKEGADYIIGMLHCGNAYQPYPGKQTQKLFERIAHETDVNFIIGGHPHNIQPLQEFKTSKGPVVAAYSLGDFIAYDIYQRCHLSIYLEINLARIHNQVQLINFKIHRNYIELKNQALRLRNFDDVKKERPFDKKIADLQQLYRQTISGN